MVSFLTISGSYSFRFMISLILVVMGIRPRGRGTTGRGSTRCISTLRFRVWTSTKTALTITVISIAMPTSKKTGNKIGIVTDSEKSKITMVARSRVTIRVPIS